MWYAGKPSPIGVPAPLSQEQNSFPGGNDRDPPPLIPPVEGSFGSYVVATHTGLYTACESCPAGLQALLDGLPPCSCPRDTCCFS